MFRYRIDRVPEKATMTFVFKTQGFSCKERFVCMFFPFVRHLLRQQTVNAHANESLNLFPEIPGKSIVCIEDFPVAVEDEFRVTAFFEIDPVCEIL